MSVSLTHGFYWLRKLLLCVLRISQEEKRRQWKSTPHISQERSPLCTSYRRIPLPKKRETYQWGSGLQARPEISSWWELVMVLGRARLVRTSSACTIQHQHDFCFGNPLHLVASAQLLITIQMRKYLHIAAVAFMWHACYLAACT